MVTPRLEIFLHPQSKGSTMTATISTAESQQAFYRGIKKRTKKREQVWTGEF
jgi:hypothetical protein